MIVVGCCVGPGGRFDRIAGPALDAVLRPEDVVVLVEDSTGICSAYNSVLRRARGLDGCEGALLIHDDLELTDPAVRDDLVAAGAEPGVGLVGVTGGAGLVWGKWWSGRRLAGRRNDSSGETVMGEVSADVDAVDGCLMFVAPRALHLEFDERAFPAFHGYDVDFSLRVRSAGLRVVTRPLAYRHVDKGSAGDVAAFEAAMRTLEATWPGFIRPLSLREKVVRRLGPFVARGRPRGA